MRRNVPKEMQRIKHGPLASRDSDGFNGAFTVEGPCGFGLLRVICSDGRWWSDSGLPGKPWEHASVSVVARWPTWEEMELVKRLCWTNAEVVIQLHVPRKAHINCHPYCLHMWKPPYAISLPPSGVTVGPQYAQGNEAAAKEATT